MKNENKSIWIVAEAFALKSNDHMIDDSLTPYAKAYMSKASAERALRRFVKSHVESNYDGLEYDDESPYASGTTVREQIKADIKWVLEDGGRVGDSDVWEYRYMPDDRAIVWRMYRTSAR